MARINKLYRTFDFINCDDGSMIYNCAKWSLEEAIDDFTFFGDRNADIIEEVYYRYLKKDEIEDDDIMWDYIYGGIPHFVECEPDYDMAIKAWHISSKEGSHEK